MNKNFVNFLNIVASNRDLFEAVKTVLSTFEVKYGSNNKLYNNEPDQKKKLAEVRNSLIDKLDISNAIVKTAIDIETASPFSIFNYILSDDFSDIIFYHDGYKQSDHLGFKDHLIRDYIEDEEQLKRVKIVYRLYFNHFISNIQTSKGEARFDPSNAILDAEAMEKFRFNLIHGSLNGRREWPIIVVRKQTIQKEADDFKQMFDTYIHNVGASEEQIETIHKYAQQGNIVLFGETGSGKTTMLRYIGNYGLENKRNLITIEDTAELGLDVPLTFITNRSYTIKDLFTAALRQNPSHVLIGETRTSEIIDIMEAALVTSVSTTIHANSFNRAIQRIIFMSVKDRDLDTNEIENLINASIDCFIYMKDRKIEKMWRHKEGNIKDVYEAYEEVK